MTSGCEETSFGIILVYWLGLDKWPFDQTRWQLSAGHLFLCGF